MKTDFLTVLTVIMTCLIVIGGVIVHDTIGALERELVICAEELRRAE